MDFFDFLTMVGGLAFFLYGMNNMADGLEKMSGGRLERLLAKLTANPLRAVLLGAAVTTFVQSSSAATVMVVGLVDSGVMQLSQATGVIMGANIGTTATAWILSLAGIESDSFFVSLLNPEAFSPVCAAVGVVFFLFSRKEKRRDLGALLCDFSVLMFGMKTMSGAVSGLQDVQEFRDILRMFANPLLGLLAGAGVTAVIQSSSASVGILQSVSETGALTCAAAFPVIMGQNIGTCVTALLSSAGAGSNAKRAAWIHLYFNLIGTAIFTAGFYCLHIFLPQSFLNAPVTSAGIALIHSFFNIGTTILLLPFSGSLIRLACLTVRNKPLRSGY